MKLVLQPSALFVVSGTDSYIDFTATYGGKDVTNDANLAVYRKATSGSVLLNDKTYNVKSSGEYSFYAVYGDIMSEIVVVKSVADLPAEVEDSAPAQYNAFRKRVLGVLVTGTWCQYCPYMIRAVHEYEEAYGENDDLVMADAHSGGSDIMRCDASDKIADRLSAVSYPTLKFGLSGKAENSILNTRQQTGEDVKAVVDSQLSTKALTAISANSTLSGTDLYVRADIKIAVDGDFKVGAWLVESGIEEYQSSALEEYMHIHNDAVFGAYPMNFSMCEAVGGVESQKGGSKHIFYCEFDLKHFSTLQNIDNADIIIFVYNDDNLVKCVDNVIKFPVGGSYAFDYEN